MRKILTGVWCLALGVALCGCATEYRYRPSVPKHVRTVAVPTFRNESNVSGIGSVASRQLLREFQREGTFKIRTNGDAAIEIQGVVKSVTPTVSAYSRRTGSRVASYELSATVVVSVIDKRNRRVIVNNRRYVARTTMTAGQDRTTAVRDASGRLMDDLARRVVDDILNLKW